MYHAIPRSWRPHYLCNVVISIVLLYHTGRINAVNLKCSYLHIYITKFHDNVLAAQIDHENKSSRNWTEKQNASGHKPEQVEMQYINDSVVCNLWVTLAGYADGDLD